MKKIALYGIVLIMIMAVFSGCTEDDNGDDEEPLDPAPDFELTSIDGDTFKLSDYEGKVVILDFMFINCNPCKEEMKHLENVSDQYSSSKVKIISIDTQYNSETEQELIDFRDLHGYDWIFAMDTDSEDVNSKYDAESYPTLVLVNKEGKIVYEHAGITDYDTLSSKIDELL